MKTFGAFKHNLVEHLSKAYGTGKFKEDFKAIFQKLNESKDFKEAFILYSDLEEKYIDDPEVCDEYIKESIAILKDKVRTILPLIEQYSSLVPDDGTVNPIYETIDALVYPISVSQIEEVIQAKKRLKKHLSKKKEKLFLSDIVNESLYATLLANSFNDMFANAPSEDITLIESYLSMPQDKLMENINSKKKEALEKLIILKESDEKEVREKVNESIDEIKEMDYSAYNLYKLETLIKDL